MEGQVIKSTGSWYSVRVESGALYNCRIKGKLRIKGIKSTNPVVVGDLVQFETEGEGDEGIIKDILPRKNYIIRKSINLSKRSHIIASNIDQALLMVTLTHPVTYSAFIDRFLVTAAAYHVPVVILFNKVDLLEDQDREQLEEWKTVYEKIGYTCHAISLHSDPDLELLNELMRDKVSVISGHSGVGKSTLINCLDPNIELRTSEVSDTHQSGVHTTTYAEMLTLASGAHIIDTPGIKGLGVIDIEKEILSHYFLEMLPLLPECRFNNCVHIKEPGCAVKAAVENGQIAEFRYKNYLGIYYDDVDEVYRQLNY